MSQTERQLPATSAVAPLVRWNSRLEQAAAPRLMFGSALAVYGGIGAAYSALLLASAGAHVLSLPALAWGWIATHLLFTVVALVAGGALSAAGVARWRGQHPRAHTLESLGFKAVASGVAVTAASWLVLTVL